MPRPPLKAVIVAAVALTAVGVTPFVSFADDNPAPTAPTVVPVELALAPGMLAAMRRDLQLDDTEIAARLTTEAAAPVVEKRLRKQLGTTFGGAWIPEGSTRLTVGVTSEADAATVRAEGADARIVKRSESSLAAARSKLDKNSAKAGKKIHSWYVDPAANTVVVTAAPGAEAAARKFALDNGAGSVTVTAVTQAPRTMADIRGGDQYVINGNTLCSVGFAVSGGFVTAGHCGGTGSPTLGVNSQAQGTFAGSSFPGNDYAWVRTNGNWVSQPWVNNYSGGNVLVSGAQEAAIGSSICRSGRTTGWRCGTLLGKNETINYPQGAVSGLNRSNACAEGGDSGGSWISGNQAQGVTSGGSGNCTSGGTMWFQPLNEILQAFGLSLTTTGSGGGGGGGAGTAIVSNWNNKCLDVPGGNFSDGVPVQMWGCNGLAPQQWNVVNGALQTGNNKCLDIPWGSTANGATLQIATCNGNPAQQWVLSAAGDLVNPQANKCMDIKNWNGNDQAQLTLWDCTGTANQKWRRA